MICYCDIQLTVHTDLNSMFLKQIEHIKTDCYCIQKNKKCHITSTTFVRMTHQFVRTCSAKLQEKISVNIYYNNTMDLQAPTMGERKQIACLLCSDQSSQLWTSMLPIKAHHITQVFPLFSFCTKLTYSTLFLGSCLHHMPKYITQLQELCQLRNTRHLTRQQGTDLKMPIRICLKQWRRGKSTRRKHETREGSSSIKIGVPYILRQQLKIGDGNGGVGGKTSKIFRQKSV